MACSKTANSDQQNKVFLWMMPRTVSTAIARSIGQIPGCEVWFEPFGFSRLAAMSLKARDGIALPPGLEYAGNEGLYSQAAHAIGARFNTTFPPEGLV